MKKFIWFILWLFVALGSVYAGLEVYNNIVVTGDAHIAWRVLVWEIRHAFWWFQLQNTTIDITTQSWWVHITNGTNNLWTGLEADWLLLSWDIMTIINTWDYFWNINISASWPNGNDICIRLWNITQSKQEWFMNCDTTAWATDFVAIPLAVYIDDDGWDQLQMEIANISPNNDVNVRSATFFMSYLHD